MLANTPVISSAPQRRAVGINFVTGEVTYVDEESTTPNTPTSIPTIMGEHSLLVYSVEGGLVVQPTNPQYVSIYNTAGQLVTSEYLSDSNYFVLPAGIYLVCGENEQVKAMVK